MISFRNRFRIALVVTFILLFVFVSFSGSDIPGAFTAYSKNNLSSAVKQSDSDNILFNDSVLFGFRLDQDKCDYLEFDINNAAYFHEHANDYSFNLLDSDKAIVSSLTRITDNNLLVYPDRDKLLSGQYYLRVMNMTDHAAPVPLYVSKSYDTTTSFFRDNTKENLALTGQSVCASSSAIKIYLAMAFYVLLIAFIMFTNKIGLRSFVLFAVFFGVLFVALQAFPASDNESVSVLQSESLTRGYLNLNATDHYWLPGNLISGMNYMSDREIPLSNDFAFFNTSPHCGITLIHMLLSGISMLAGLLNLPYFWHIAAVRTACYIITSIIAGASIYISVNHKKLFFFLATIPGIFLAFTTISSFAIACSMTLFFLSCACNGFECYDSEKCILSSVRPVFMLLFFAFIGSQNLLVMFVLLILLFSIPEASFARNRKNVAMWLFTLVMLLIIGMRVYFISLNSEYFVSSFNDMIKRLTDLVSSPALILSSFVPFLSGTVSGMAQGLVVNSASEPISLCAIAIGIVLFILGSSTLVFWRNQKNNPDASIDSERALYELRAYNRSRSVSVFTAVLTAFYVLLCYLSPELFNGGIWAVFAVLFAMLCVRHRVDQETLDIPVLFIVASNIALVFVGLFLQ